MDLNPMQKLEDANSPTPTGPPETVDELNNQGNKLIAKLNHDCLAKVFMHLPILERLEMENVCQKWEEATEFSWYNVRKLDLNDLMIPLDKKNETLEMLMIKCCRFLRHLTITADDHYPWMSSLLKDNCKNIINFSIDMKTIRNKWKISPEDIVEILGSMAKLKYLKVKMGGCQSRDLAHKIVDKLPKDIHEIHLISENKYCANKNIYKIIDKLPNDIHEIHLISQEKYWSIKTTPVLNKFKSLHCLTLHGFSLSNETLEIILENNNTLIKLDLSRCEFPSDGIPIFKNLNNLEEIILYDVEDLDVNEIASITRNCLKVKHFELMNVTRRGIFPVPLNIYRQLKYLNLEHLSIYGLDRSVNEDEHVLAGMTNNWKQLKYLNIDRGCNFSTRDLDEIIKLTNLQYLNIRQIHKIKSEESIIISKTCLELKELLMDKSNLSEAAIFELANLKKLEKLDFFDNDNLNDYLLERILNNCKNLVELRVSDCKNVTETSLIQIGKLENLKKLVLDGNNNVPNAMFHNNFKKLEYLSCYNCSSITDEGIIKVLDNCQKLSYLSLCKTGITVESLVHASKRKFVFKLLKIFIDSHVEYEYKKINCTPSPYLIICSS